MVRVSVGGKELRVRLTNEFGTAPLEIGAAHVAVSADNSPAEGSIQPGTDRELTFGGRSTVTIPAGGVVFSDGLAMTVPALSTLDVSVYLPPQPLTGGTCHRQAHSTNFISHGDAASTIAVKNAEQINSWCFVSGVDVQAEKKAVAVVALGDSITDGGHSMLNMNHRWPNFLAERLQASRKTADVGVLNEGIGGNRILHGGEANPNAIARFDRDALAQSGVKYLVILEGINDLGSLARGNDSSRGVSAQNLIFGLSQLVKRAHNHGIKVFGATITPYEGAGYFSSTGERERQTVNQWIRTSGTFDRVVDFDKVLRDPADPTRLLPAYDHGDHLHPSDAGYKAMAGSIPLDWFR